MSFFKAPVRSSPSQALNNRRSVIKELNRETTMAKRLPDASSLPSKAPSVFGTDSIFSVSFFAAMSVSPVGPYPTAMLVVLSHSFSRIMQFAGAYRLHRSFAVQNAAQDDNSITPPPLKDYFPLNCAARFSRNAFVPSVLSSVEQATANRRASR